MWVRGCMVFRGLWATFSDGKRRPMIGAELQKADGTFKGDVFLIDSGADRTIITADLLSDLGCTAYQPTAHPGMIGLGGAANFQFFRSTLRLSAPNGDVFLFSAEF